MTERMNARELKISERQAENGVCQVFELYGWSNDRLREDITRGTPGIPDRLFTSREGLQLWVEMKRPPSQGHPRGHVRVAQMRWLIAKRKRSVCCCVLDGIEEAHGIAASFSYAGAGQTIEMLRDCDRLMASYDWWPAR